MKRLLLFALSVFALNTNAQDSESSGRSFKVDGNFGSAMTFGTFKSFGISAATEPKYFINHQIAFGLRLEANVLFGGAIADSDVDVRMSTRTCIAAKAEYYFMKDNTRPFVGLMVGRYVQANLGSNSSGNASIGAGQYIGFAPEVGITFNNFRISGIYHFVPGADLVTVDVGQTKKVGRNYFVAQFGWCFGQRNFD